MLVEHPINIKRVYSVIWRRSKLDLAELAKNRWVNKWSIKRLATHHDRAQDTIQMHLSALRKSDKWMKLLLSQHDRKLISKSINTPFKGVD